MRIAVSGAHGSGKSTLIEDFLRAHPDYAHEPEPYEWLAELYNEPMPAMPGAEDFYRQLEISVERLATYERGACVIVERSPIDFLAYIRALKDDDLETESLALVETGMRHVDLLVVLPIDDSLTVPDEEDPELREAMNDRLLELIPGCSGDARAVEVAGTRQQRLSAVTDAMLTFGHGDRLAPRADC
ncbi:MAG TPA: ATP-binding protein [Thermoanaerobaculia bacterium]|nr:ATP-binding protein [Thermoanaerobaculia bacterium]